MSATDGSSDSPCATARRSARKTSFGRRARWTSSLKVSEPKSSVALRCPTGAFHKCVSSFPERKLIMAAAGGAPQEEKWFQCLYILNDVRQIKPQDFYAP